MTNLYQNLLELIKGEQKVGLALGGGAVYGAAHVGVLRALEEHDLKVDYISGTSIGAFIAALYANDLSWKDIEKAVIDLKWLDISHFSISKFGMLSNRKFTALVKDCIGEITFEESKIPLAVVAADIRTGEKVIINEGSVADAIMASTCIPGIFKPVKWKDRLLVDGGIVENVPISPLKTLGADYIIAVDLNTGIANKQPSNIVEVLINAFHFTMMTATKYSTEKADLNINPNLSNFNRYSTGQIKMLIAKGYEDALGVLQSEGK